MLQAPNRQSIVSKYIDLHPDWAKDELLRGQIIDLACAEANALDGGVWGRKSRNAAGTDLNTDGMCFKRSDGLHEIYDAITGSGGSSWDAYGPFKAGDNGYWVPAKPVSDTDPNLAAKVAALEADLTALKARVRELETARRSTRVALRTDNGRYLCAEGGGGGEVNATRPTPGPWETFSVEDQG